MSQHKNTELGEYLCSKGFDVVIREDCVLVTVGDTFNVVYYSGKTIDHRDYYIVQRESRDWKAETCYSLDEVHSLF